VLACGRGAVISHHSAAGSVWRMLDVRFEPIDVTIPRSNRRRPGLLVHRSRILAPEDRRVVRGIPVTSPERTLIDLAETADDRELERAYDEALTQRLMTTASFTAAVQRARGRRGTRRINRLVGRDTEPAITRSEAERRLLELTRAAGLPAARTNVAIGGYTVDFEWRAQRLIVEVDGHQFHSTRSAFERDRRRDAGLTAAGYRVARVTWRQLESEPLAVVARLPAALARA
jgi:very-short-patch-repair endonuclease